MLVALVVLLKGVLAFYICCFTLLGLYGPRFFLIARGDSFKTADMFLRVLLRPDRWLRLRTAIVANCHGLLNESN